MEYDSGLILQQSFPKSSDIGHPYGRIAVIGAGLTGVSSAA